MFNHILNLVELAKVAAKTDKKPPFYYHLNLLFKGARGQCSKEELQSVKKALIAEHKKNLAFIDKEITFVSKNPVEHKRAS